MGPQPVSGARTTARARADAAADGLRIVDLREETVRVEFFDVGAVVWFLRKVIWTVPDFSVERYRDRLVAMHEHIGREGSFVSRRAAVPDRRGRRAPRRRIARRSGVGAGDRRERVRHWRRDPPQPVAVDMVDEVRAARAPSSSCAPRTTTCRRRGR